MLKKLLCIIFAALCITSVTAITASATGADRTNAMLADTTLDNSINIKDATNIQKFVAGISKFSDLQNAAADVDRNTNVNVKDATALQKHLAGFQVDFPIGQLVDVSGNLVEGEVTTQPVETQPEPETRPSEPTFPTLPDVSEEDVITDEVLRRIEEGFLRLVNAERAKHGLANLTRNDHIDDVAQQRSAELIESYSHLRPDGTQFYQLIDRNKYHYISLGENICKTTHAGNKPFDPIKDRFVASDEQIEDSYTNIFIMFKNSPIHYDNIMRANFEHTGIGISCVFDKERGIPYFYVSQIFSAD